MNFSEGLTPGQIQQVLTALDIPWQEYEASDNGWITVDPEDILRSTLYNDYPKLGININHGGFQDHTARELKGQKGDIVRLVELFKFGENSTSDAIEWIKEVTGIDKGLKPPELGDDYKFANDWLGGDKNFVMLPRDVLHSELKPSERLVWAEIFDRVGKGKFYSFAGIRDISKQLNISKSTVQRAIKHLADIGLIIEKSMGYKQRTLRYPLVADMNKINEVLKDL